MKERFFPEGIRIGRTTARTIQEAHDKLPISARVYMDLEDKLTLNPEHNCIQRAEKVLWRVIRQPKVLKSMGEFIELRDKLLKGGI